MTDRKNGGVVKSRYWICCAVWGVALGVGPSTALGASPGESENLPVARIPHVKTAHRKRRGQAREKETEGTEAPNRFKTDTIIRSQYQLDGKPLEVDPD